MRASPGPAARDVTPREQLGRDALGPREAPGGDGASPCEHGLQRAPAPGSQHRPPKPVRSGAPAREQRRLETVELGGMLVRQHHLLLRP